MNLIPIPNPTGYFQFVTNVGNDVWLFVFTWNQKYSLFHVDVYLNNEPQILSKGVHGGVQLLNDYSNGYNFLLYGTDPTAPADLGVTLKLYQITSSDALNLGLIRNGIT